MKENVRIWYASQTGTAQHFADYIVSKVVEWKFHVHKIDRLIKCPLLDENIMVAPNEFWIFIISTTGEGEIPLRDGYRFWRELMDRTTEIRPNTIKIDFCVIALGDSSYVETYNFAGKKLFRRLIQLGLESTLGVVLFDDQSAQGVEHDFIEFVNTTLHKCLHKKFEPSFQGSITSDRILRTLYQNRAHVIEKRRLTSDGHKPEVYLLSMEMMQPRNFFPGAVVYIKPKNFDRSIKIFTDRYFNDHGQRSIFYSTEEIEFDRKLDLNAVPSVLFIRWMVDVIEEKAERPFRNRMAEELDRLKELCDPDNYDEYIDYLRKPRRTLLEFAQEFPKCMRILAHSITDTYFTDFNQSFTCCWPAVRYRPYSVASNHERHNGRIDVIFSVVEYKTSIHRKRLGLCSNYLERVEVGELIHCDLAPNGSPAILGAISRQPQNRAIFMIATGTGIAPFRNLIYLQMFDRILFYGCRYEHKDFLIRTDLEELAAEDERFKYFVCFSRQPKKRGQSGKYVQDLMREHSQIVHEQIYLNFALVIVCGRGFAKSPDGVELAIVDAIAEHSAISESEALQYVEQMKKSKRLIYEVWD